MPPTFSVVIPTYNQADFLKFALQSVLGQSFQDFEVIVVNNYSTDHTLEVVEQLRDPRVQVINFRNNGVIGAGRNTGIRASCGEYVAFLDSDDTWASNKLERVHYTIKQDPGLGLVCHDQTLVQNGRTTGRSHYGPSLDIQGNMYDYLLLGIDGPSTSATVVCREYLDEVGLFSEEPQHITVEDYDLWLKLARVCRFKFLRDVLGTHNYHSASASARIELHLRNTLNVLDHHFQQANDQHSSYSKTSIQRRYAYAYYGAARQYQRQGMVKKSLRHGIKTIQTYPLLWRAYAVMALLSVSPLLIRSESRQTSVTAMNEVA